MYEGVDCVRLLETSSRHIIPVLHDQESYNQKRMMAGFLPEANHRIVTAIQISKTRALNAVSMHKYFKDLLRSYKNLGYLVEIPQ